MKQETLYEKAVRLCEGGIVLHEGHYIRAIAIDANYNSCIYCDMDLVCICNTNVCELCVQCDIHDGKKHILKFAYKKINEK